jgi:hypothetical protein
MLCDRYQGWRQFTGEKGRTDQLLLASGGLCSVNWIIYAIVAAAGLAAADVCLKLAAGRISSGLGLLSTELHFLHGLGWFL